VKVVVSLAEYPLPTLQDSTSGREGARTLLSLTIFLAAWQGLNTPPFA